MTCQTNKTTDMKNPRYYLTELQSTRLLNHVRETRDFTGFSKPTLLPRLLKSLSKGYITRLQLNEYLIWECPMITEPRNKEEEVLVELTNKYFK